jgi:hypothetical protein
MMEEFEQGQSVRVREGIYCFGGHEGEVLGKENKTNGVRHYTVHLPTAWATCSFPHHELMPLEPIVTGEVPRKGANG